MKLRFSKKALARLPVELRHNTNNITIQKMQLLALIRHPDTRENMRAVYLTQLKMIIRKQKILIPIMRSQRVH
jgi:hypothetical protein